jgi:hypothetical protein
MASPGTGRAQEVEQAEGWAKPSEAATAKTPSTATDSPSSPKPDPRQFTSEDTPGRARDIDRCASEQRPRRALNPRPIKFHHTVPESREQTGKVGRWLLDCL